MAEDGNTQTFTPNTDGTISIKMDGKDIRYAPESDLLAVKRGSETKETAWGTKESSYQTQLAEATRVQGESHTNLLQERAALEVLTEKTKNYDTLTTRVGELETAAVTHTDTVGKLETEIAEHLRTALVGIHGAKEDAIKEKDLTQLRTLLESAKVFGTNGGSGNSKPANYDGGPDGPGAGSVPETPEQRAQRILDDAKATGHHFGGIATAGAPPPPKVA